MTDTKIETKSFSCPIFNKNVEIEATVDFIYDESLHPKDVILRKKCLGAERSGICFKCSQNKK